MRFSISEVSSAASGSSTRHGTLKSAGMTPSAASSCNALSRLPPAVTAWTPFSAGRGVNDEVLLEAPGADAGLQLGVFGRRGRRLADIRRGRDELVERDVPNGRWGGGHVWVIPRRAGKSRSLAL